MSSPDRPGSEPTTDCTVQAASREPITTSAIDCHRAVQSFAGERRKVRTADAMSDTANHRLVTPRSARNESVEVTPPWSTTEVPKTNAAIAPAKASKIPRTTRAVISPREGATASPPVSRAASTPSIAPTVGARSDAEPRIARSVDPSPIVRAASGENGCSRPATATSAPSSCRVRGQRHVRERSPHSLPASISPSFFAFPLATLPLPRVRGSLLDPEPGPDAEVMPAASILPPAPTMLRSANASTAAPTVRSGSSVGE